MSNPYRGLPDICFWSRAMTSPAPGHIDPVVRSRSISRSDKVATMGSCFAQHLARHIKASGLNYYVPENAPEGISAAEAAELNYGTFSARYGNIYTVRQAIQLFDRAFGAFIPTDDVWETTGGFVDAFRPQIQSTPFATPEAVREAARQHFVHVRNVFTQSKWLVFTLGLTEAWRSRTDGAIYPVAPGVGAGAFSEDRYEFVNFSASEVSSDLSAFIERIKSVNPNVTILLTVSPVPLIATYERRHVWVSTTFSKAALRVAVDEAERKFDNVIYFPSYEIITSPAAGARYFDDDLRQVRKIGVKHVMRIFEKHFFDSSGSVESAPPEKVVLDLGAAAEIVCDEEVIEAALKASGVASR